MAELSGWAYRIKITVDNTNIDSDLTQFPVPIILGTSVGQSSQDISCVFDSIGANYLKIAITKADGTTQIYGEVEQWDSVSEKALIWVAKSDLDITSSTATELYLYYDPNHTNNTTYIGTPGDTVVYNIYDAHYTHVIHYAQDPSGGSGCILDSTSNGNNGTPSGTMLTADLVDGDYGKAIDFDGTDDYIIIPGASFDAFTFEFNLKTTSLDDERTIIANNYPTETSPYLRTYLRNGEGSAGTDISALFVDDDDQTWYDNDAHGISINNFHYVTEYISGVTLKLDIDNVNKLSDVGSISPSSTFTTNFYIGANDDGVASGLPFIGQMSEFRISDITRSDAWRKATYYALNDNLLTFGAAEDLDEGIVGNGVGTDLFTDNIGVLVESGSGNSTFSDNIGASNESIIGNGSLSALAEIQGVVSESASGGVVFTANRSYIKGIQESGSGNNAVSATKGTIGSMSETGIGSDSFLPGIQYEHNLSETITIWGIPSSSWVRTIAESVTSTDAVTLQLLVKVSEYLQLKETLVTKWDGVEVISDSVIARDTVVLIQAISEIISESIVSTDAPSVLTGLFVHEYLAMKETLGSNLSISRSISESITATDSVVSSWIRTLTESITATDSVNALLSLLISEGITMAEALSSVGTFSNGLAETITATDSVSRAFDLSASDTIAIVDAPTAIASFFKSIADTVTSTDTVAGTNIIAITTTESIALVDTVVSGAAMYLSVTDGVLIGATIELDDEIYECFVLNTPSFFPSVYSGFDFNSYCVYNSRAFGANNTGIFELTGTTDNGTAISSGVMTHETDFGERNKKRFRKAYIGLDGTSSKMVMETGDGERKVYDIDGKGMVDASKTIQGREWVLSVTNFDELKSLKLIPVILARGK